MIQPIRRVIPLMLMLFMGVMMAQITPQQEDVLARIAQAGMAYRVVDASELDLLERACDSQELSKSQKLALLDILERVRSSAPQKISYEDLCAARSCVEDVMYRSESREPRLGSSDVQDIDDETVTYIPSEIAIRKITGVDGEAVSITDVSQITPASGGMSIDLGPVQTKSLSQVDSASVGDNVISLAFGADGFLYAGTSGDEVLKFNPSDLSQVDNASVGDSPFALAFGADGFLYAGTDGNEVLKFDALDIGDQLAISNIAPAEDLQNYQLMLVANDGSRVRRSLDTADEFQNIISSSAYAKRNIGPLDDAAQQLVQVEPISFQYRGDKDDSHMHFGVRAEELAAYVPELVRYDAYGNPERIRYIEMVPLLLKALQNQKDALQVREQENAELCGRVSRLEKLVEL